MAGHSKWANIKHKKEATDKKKGRVFSRLAKEIMVAARIGGGDVDANPRLRTALTAAKSANMPNNNIERAMKKGLGELGDVNYEEIIYEGYGPAGVAVMVECLTDNRNRSASEVRMVFDRSNGNLGNSGAVSWMFHRKARFLITDANYVDEEKLMEITMDVGAEEIDVDEEVAEIWADPESFEAVAEALKNDNVVFAEAGIVRRPETMVELDELSTAQQVLRMIDKLEDLDDVQAVTANFTIADAIAEQLEDE